MINNQNLGVFYNIIIIGFAFVGLCYIWYLYVKTGSKRRLFSLIMYIVGLVITYLSPFNPSSILICFFGSAILSATDDKMYHKDELEREENNK